MDEKTYTIPYGEGQITFDLPPDMRGTVVESKNAPSSFLSIVQKFN